MYEEAISMSSNIERAQQLYTEEGFCCAEAVWLAFAESGGLSEEEKAFGNKLAFAFCGGTGAQDLCGALAGGALVLGCRFGRVPGEPRNEDLPKYSKVLIDDFKEQYGFTDCCDLKPKTEPAVAKEVCSGYVAFVIAKMENLLRDGIDKQNSACT